MTRTTQAPARTSSTVRSSKKKPTRPSSGGRGRSTTARRMDDPRIRMLVLAGAALLVLCLVFAKLFMIQGMDNRALAQQALDSRLVTKTLPADRGTILSSDGTVLASTASRYNLVVDQQNVAGYENEDGEVIGAWGAAQALADPLDTEPALIYPELAGDKRWNVVASGVTSEVWNSVEELDIPGISVEEYSTRTYPAGGVGGNIVGFTSSDGDALAGLELGYDDMLSGTDGSEQYERGLNGDMIPLGEGNTTPAVDGTGIQLSIDTDLQYYAQQAIAAQVEKHDAESGSIVIEEVGTGKVLVAAEAPTVDPNNPGGVDPEDRGSRIFSDVFEPGSTSKMITAAALLEEGLVEPTSQFTVPYEWEADNGEVFKDSHEHEDEQLTFAGILRDSSNTGTILAGQQLTEEQRYEYLYDFGFGQTTGIDFPGATAGILHPADEWDGRTKYTVMFGQGVAATALQTTSAMATIANDGVKMPVRLIDGTVDDSGKITKSPESDGERVISAEASDELMTMLEGVVVDGTGSSAQIPGYRVAGKTGTAQAPAADGSGYDGYTASFVGVAPAEDPKIAVSVTLQRPRNGYYGGTAAAPVFSDVTGYALRHLNIAPSTTEPDLYPEEWD